MIFTLMSDETIEIKMGGIGGIIIAEMERVLCDGLRARGLSSVTVKAVWKGGKPTIEFSGPEEDVRKARQYFEKVNKTGRNKTGRR